MAQYFHFSSTALRGFDGQFPELNKASQHYRTVALQDANQILEAELARSGEHVEFFELSFPQNVIATWGTVMIVAIHLYFWLHLRAFYSRPTPNDPDFNIGWVGLYFDPWAHLVTLASVSLLPLSVIVYLACKAGQGAGGPYIRSFASRTPARLEICQKDSQCYTPSPVPNRFGRLPNRHNTAASSDGGTAMLEPRGNSRLTISQGNGVPYE